MRLSEGGSHPSPPPEPGSLGSKDTPGRPDSSLRAVGLLSDSSFFNFLGRSFPISAMGMLGGKFLNKGLEFLGPYCCRPCPFTVRF